MAHHPLQGNAGAELSGAYCPDPLEYGKALGSPCGEVDPGIDHHVGQIADQFQQKPDQGEDIEGGEHDRVVAVDRRLETEEAETSSEKMTSINNDPPKGRRAAFGIVGMSYERSRLSLTGDRARGPSPVGIGRQPPERSARGLFADLAADLFEAPAAGARDAMPRGTAGHASAARTRYRAGRSAEGRDRSLPRVSDARSVPYSDVDHHQ
jgi:hypothetical protein